MMATRQLIAAAIFLSAASLQAQGNLSSQGFGYPPGGLSARSLGTGGGLAEVEPLTTSNPAGLALWSRPGLYLQFEPEYRRVNTAAATERGLIARFPMITAALALGPRATASVSATTLLDRTWSVTQTFDTEVGGDSVEATINHRSTGAMNDIRLAGAWTHSANLQLGVGLHYFTGMNRVTVNNTFDRPDFGTLTQQSEVSFGGPAASLGVVFRPGLDLIVGGSVRKGGTLTAQRSEVAISEAGVPDRAGISVGYLGLSGVSIGAHYGWDGWSAMNGLGSDETEAQDTRDMGLGVETAGPSVRGTMVTLRGGARWRTLPFLAAGSQVGEQSLIFGFGVPLAGGNSALDVAIQRARRTNDGTVTETGWTVSLGLAVRP
jgi:hypothetical protein